MGGLGREGGERREDFCACLCFNFGIQLLVVFRRKNVFVKNGIEIHPNRIEFGRRMNELRRRVMSRLNEYFSTRSVSSFFSGIADEFFHYKCSSPLTHYKRSAVLSMQSVLTKCLRQMSHVTECGR